MTVRELAGQLQCSPACPEAEIVVELLREYEHLRYRQAPPSLDVVLTYERKVRRQLSTCRRHGDRGGIVQ